MANRTGELTGGGVSGGQIAGLIAVFLVCLSAGYLVPKFFFSPVEDVTEPEPVAVEPVQVDPIPVPQEDPMGIPVIREVSPSVLSGDTYRITILADVPNGQTFDCVLHDYLGEEIQHSPDGVFVGVAPSDSIYRVVAVNLATGQRSEEVEILDCIIPRPTVEKVSASKLSSMINSGNYSANFSKFWIREHAPSCHLRFSGLKQDEIIPDSFADLCDRVNLEGWSCTVLNIDYNDMNQMTAVQIAVTYSE